MNNVYVRLYEYSKDLKFKKEFENVLVNNIEILQKTDHLIG